MKIDANDKEVQEIFQQGYFKIPRFQRPYSWVDDEVNNFWRDVVKENNDNYFIGSMVVYQTQKPYFGIVDGQQRLTTITLMLAAVRNAFIILDENDLAKGVHNYIERANVDNKNEFILNSETSFPYLQEYIQSYDGSRIECEAGAEEQNLQKAFDFISKQLNEEIPDVYSGQMSLFDDNKTKSIDTLKGIRDKILSLKLVFIQLDSEEDAYLIFETLNARGRDLTTSDLVKNLLLKKIRSNNVLLDPSKEMWNGILRRFDDAGMQNSMEAFLYHYWLSRYEYTTEKKLFDKVKAVALDDSQARSLLEDLQRNAGYYLSIIAPDSYNWTKEENSIQKSFDSLSLFNVKQQHPMTLSLMRAYREKKIKLKKLKHAVDRIEYFHYVFNAITSQRSSGSISTHYSRYAISLSKAEQSSDVQSIIEEMLEGLNDKLPSFNEFLASFEDLTYLSKRTKSKSIIKHTLARIMGFSTNGLSIDHPLMTIEHILPESNARNGITEESVVGNIGNLILVDKKTNSEELADLPFQQKKQILMEKKYPFDEYLVRQDYWGEDQIRERAKILAQIAYGESK